MYDINIIKKLAIKGAALLKIPLNYGGLRIETLELVKKLGKERKTVSDNDKKRTNYILFFGDSNIFGWNYAYKDSIPVRLEEKLKTASPEKEYVVINFGIGGTKITDFNIGLLGLLSNIDKENHVTAVLNYGLNDGQLSDMLKNYFKKNKSYYNWEQLYSENFEDEYKKFLNKYLDIIRILLKKNIKIILIGLHRTGKTRIIKKWSTENRHLKFQNAVLCSLNKRIKEAAVKTGAGFIDLWNISGSLKIKENYLQRDRLHLNLKAYELISDEIKTILQKTK